MEEEEKLEEKRKRSKYRIYLETLRLDEKGLREGLVAWISRRKHRGTIFTRWWWDVIRSAPLKDLLLAEFLDGLFLVKTLKTTVVSE